MECGIQAHASLGWNNQAHSLKYPEGWILALPAVPIRGLPWLVASMAAPLPAASAPVEAAIVAARRVAMVTGAPAVVANVGASGVSLAAPPVLESLRKEIPEHAHSEPRAQLVMTTMTFPILMQSAGSDQGSLLMRLSTA